MKKRLTKVILSFVLMFAMVLGISIPAFAYSKEVTITSATDSQGNNVEATFVLDQFVDSEFVQVFWNNEDSIKVQNEIIAYYGYEDLASVPHANGSLDLTNTNASNENPVTLTFKMVSEIGEEFPTTEKDCKWLYVFQQLNEETYKLIPAKCDADNTATAQFTDAVESKILIIELDLGWEGIVGDIETIGEIGSVQSATDSLGQDVTVKVEALDPDLEAVAITQAIDTYGCDTAIAAADISLQSGTVSESNPITVTFSIQGVATGDTISVIHKKADGTWEKLAGTAGDGTVTVTFTSLSPVLFARTTPPAPTPTPTPTTPVVNPQPQLDEVPKTGEVDTIAILYVVALLSGAGMVCVYKRKK